MELGVYVPVRVWVGRSSGSYDAHSFPPSYPPQPARLAGGCTAPGLLAGDRTGPGDSGGTLAFTTLHGDAYALSGPRYPALAPTAPGIPDADYRGRLPRVRAQKVRRRRGDRAVGILGVGEGSPRRTAPSPRSVAACRSLARSGTRRIRECGPARATATAVSRIEAISKQFATNSRNSLLFGRSAVRLYRGGREKIELVIV
jgi:hypothetical protein